MKTLYVKEYINRNPIYEFWKYQIYIPYGTKPLCRYSLAQTANTPYNMENYRRNIRGGSPYIPYAPK